MADCKTQHCVIELLLLLCNTKRGSYCTEKIKIATENQWLDYDYASLQNPTNENATLQNSKTLEILYLDTLACIVLIPFVASMRDNRSSCS